VHGGRGEELTRDGRMGGEMDKGNKVKMDPIMMDEDQMNNIMETTGKMCSGIPHQYKINNKKRAIDEREGLASDEKEVEDLCDMEKIEEIFCTTYERKIDVPRVLK
jgi:hypothetical protein